MKLSHPLPLTFAFALGFLAATSAAYAVRADAAKPPMGWNSFDSYGVYLPEAAARANLEAMAEKLKPFGYEYFVIDNGWFGEYRLKPGTNLSVEKHAARLNLDEYGYFTPSKTYFPSGFAPLIQRCHELGLKFGVHLMRGIPRQAVEANLPIEGTPYHARDIADTRTENQCKWCLYNYAVDMSKPGAQAWYDGLIRHLTDQGIDFIKYDDIVPYPREIEAVAEAIRKVKRPVVLSLSPGGKVDPNDLSAFQRANALRVTNDIWDNQVGIDRCFAAWKKWSGHEKPGFWIDMDMIPFGELQLMTPRLGDSATNAEGAALAGEGSKRHSKLSPAQMATFITMRALAASPLIMGGDLISLDPLSLKLITDAEVIACNQNGVMGKLVYESDGLEIWSTDEKGRPGHGWIGVFNRTEKNHEVTLTPATLGLKNATQVTDIWNDRRTLDVKPNHGSIVSVPGNGALFLRLP